ncbi:MAG: DUF2095 family protein [Promethearchaeota archaeon]
MPHKKNEEKEKFIELKVNGDDKLNILYAKGELQEYFPNLTSEINQGKKSIKISAVEKEKGGKNNSDNFELKYEENISNPGVIDFLRRCSTIEEAIEILEYMNVRKEIPEELFNYLRERIFQKEGLIKLIDEYGGPKKKGYYIYKFYDNLNLD